jgi:hypothetical protein
MKKNVGLSVALERRILQTAIAVFALIPIIAGADGIVRGLGMVTPTIRDIALDSHFRYLSGLLLGIGLAFWGMVPSIERKSGPFVALTFVVFVGGMARLMSLIFVGKPDLPMLFGLVMELLVTPLLCLWQLRIARRSLEGIF